MNATISTIPPDSWILIPSYNSASSLKTLLEKLLAVVPADRICVVDDASEDTTTKVCAALSTHCISHSVNSGKGAALATGFAYLLGRGARWIVTMDSDGQHAPEDLGSFFDSMRKFPRTGIIIGARDMHIGTMPFARILSNRLTSLLLSHITGSQIIDSQCGYRAYSAEFLSKIAIRYKRFEMESEVIIKACRLGYPVISTPVQTLYLDETSHISHLRDTIRWAGAVITVWLGHEP